MKSLFFLPFLGLTLASLLLLACRNSAEARDVQAYKNTAAKLGADLGLPVFLRVVKEERVLELWVKRTEGWVMKKRYPILGMSGTLGPKTKEGDRQAPEGFYAVQPGALNPKSNYHLSFNIGYPNAYDRQLGRTGSLIMVHGEDVSIGCIAMGNNGIEEIYTMVADALAAGQPQVPVQVYPFEMSPARMAKEKGSPHYAFWQTLLPGWQHTREKRAPYP